jgi:hypothetical protein
VALKLKTYPILGEGELIFTKSQLNNFPNPFLNETTITFDVVSKNSIIEIFDLSGKKVDSWTLKNKQSAIKWDASGKPGGIYCVRLKSGNEIIAIRKIILLN